MFWLTSAAYLSASSSPLWNQRKPSGFVSIAPSLAADYFGGKALGSIIGALYSGVAFGALLGSPVAGYAYDFFGSYAGAILGGAALCLASFVITLLTPDPARWLTLRKASA